MDDGRAPIGWGRAMLVSLAILAIGVGLLVFVPNWALTQLTGLSRDGRVAVSTAGFSVLLVSCVWMLRRLQARGVI